MNLVDQTPPVPEHDYLDDVYTITFDEIRKNMSTLITSVTMHGILLIISLDSNMSLLIEQSAFVNHLKKWMNLSDSRDEEDIRMCAALCVGNLARSDDSCSKLILKYHIESFLIPLLQFEHDKTVSMSAENRSKKLLKVIHATAGALKNLSLSGKTII
jgi:hypothetical protein